MLHLRHSEVPFDLAKHQPHAVHWSKMAENEGSFINGQPALSPSDLARDLARDEWRDVYHNGSYTSLLMLDFWIRKREITYEDYLRNPEGIIDEEDMRQYTERVQEDHETIAQDGEFPRTKEWLCRLSDNEFDGIIENGTGRCTSFAIQTVRALDRKYKDKFNFKYYRLGIHHLARCTETDVVIDSTSEPFFLTESKPINIDPSTDSYTRRSKLLPGGNKILSGRIPLDPLQGGNQASDSHCRIYDNRRLNYIS